jgi:hypothetical protein
MNKQQDPEAAETVQTKEIPAVDLPRLVLCSFDLAWRGKCGEPNCEKHASLKCGSCGAPATHECDETMGLVCGVPLCADCEHEISEDGTNGRTMRHCRKDAQKFLPWYARDSSQNVNIHPR